MHPSWTHDDTIVHAQGRDRSPEERHVGIVNNNNKLLLLFVFFNTVLPCLLLIWQFKGVCFCLPRTQLLGLLYMLDQVAFSKKYLAALYLDLKRREQICVREEFRRGWKESSACMQTE